MFERNERRKQERKNTREKGRTIIAKKIERHVGYEKHKKRRLRENWHFV